MGQKFMRDKPAVCFFAQKHYSREKAIWFGTKGSGQRPDTLLYPPDRAACRLTCVKLPQNSVNLGG